MKKLEIFEEVNNDAKSMKDTVAEKNDHRGILVCWKWGKDFDFDTCTSFFNRYREVIKDLETPYTGCDEAARLFLLGCSFGHAVAKCDNPSDIDIIEIDYL